MFWLFRLSANCTLLGGYPHGTADTSRAIQFRVYRRTKCHGLVPWPLPKP